PGQARGLRRPARAGATAGCRDQGTAHRARQPQGREGVVKVAVISDVHGNLRALEAVLEDIARQGVDLTVNLGDLVSGPLEPREALDRAMALDCPTIAGNHERTLSGDKPDLVDGFAAAQLTEGQKAWIKALPRTLVVDD